MKVKLTVRFQKQFSSVVDYITDNFGFRPAEDFTQEAETMGYAPRAFSLSFPNQIEEKINPKTLIKTQK